MQNASERAAYSLIHAEKQGKLYYHWQASGGRRYAFLCIQLLHGLIIGRLVFANLESRKYEIWKAQKWRGTSEIIKNYELWEILSGQLAKHKWTVTDNEHSYSNWMKDELRKWQKA